MSGQIVAIRARQRPQVRLAIRNGQRQGLTVITQQLPQLGHLTVLVCGIAQRVPIIRARRVNDPDRTGHMVRRTGLTDSVSQHYMRLLVDRLIGAVVGLKVRIITVLRQRRVVHTIRRRV